MWDDMTPFLVADPASPIVTVLDPDLTPNHILKASLGGSVRVDWSFTGPATWVLDHVQFTLNLYAESLSGGGTSTLGTVNPPLSEGPFSVSITIPPNSLAADVYRLTTVIMSADATTGNPANIAGFTDGPVIQVRP